MLVQQLVNGLTIGSTYALVTIGFTMIYSVLGLTNFAHNSFYMLGAYITMTIVVSLSMSTGSFFLGLAAAIVVCGGLAMLMDRLALRTIRNKRGAGITALLCTVGIQTIINNSVTLFFGSDSKRFPDVFDLGRFTVGNVIISYMQIIVMAAVVLLMVGISLIIYRTNLGRGMRAISQNTAAARLMGVNVNGIIMVTFFIASAAAAIAGTLVGNYYHAVDITMASSVGFKSFAAAILGGMGSLPGAVLGGVLIGVFETLVAAYISSGYRDAVAFLILIIVLIIRPTGLFGEKESSKL